MFRKLGKALVGALAVFVAAAPLVLAQISGTGPSGQTGTGPAGPGNTRTGTGNMGSQPDRPSTGSEPSTETNRPGTPSPGQGDRGSTGSRPTTPGEGSMSGQSDARKGIDSPRSTMPGAPPPTTEPSDTATRK